MQWDGTPNAGFSTGKPWLPVDRDFQKNNAQIQERSSDSLLSFYRRLTWLRKNHPALRSGGIRFLEEYLPDALVYARENGAEVMLVVLNFTAKPIFMKPSTPPRRMEVLLCSRQSAEPILDLDEGIDIRPYEVLIAKGVAVHEKQ